MANILIIEKDPVALRILVMMLLRENHHLGVVSNENEAVSYLSSCSVDLVIAGMDPSIPNDLKLLGKLRACQGCNDLPVVFYTDSGQQEYIDRALAKGVNSILTKPFSSWELYRVVKQTLNQPGIEYCIYADKDCFCIENIHPENCPLKKDSSSQDALQLDIMIQSYNH